MKYAFNTWPYGSFPTRLPAYPLEEAIRRIARIGYDGIEIGCASPHAWPGYLSAARRSELLSIMQGEGLPAISLVPATGGGPGFNAASPYPEERAATVILYKDVIDLAIDFRANLVVYLAGWVIYGTSRRDAWAHSLECLNEIAAYAAERSVVMAIEPTPTDGNLLESSDDALAFMRAVAAPNVKVMSDTAQSAYRQDNPADCIRSMADDLVHVHCADTRRLAPGDGDIDWLNVMQAVRDIKFDGYLTMEIGFTSRAHDPDRFARRALSYLKEIERQLS